MLNEHRPYMAKVERVLVNADLRQDFEYAGAPDRAGKIALLRRMDVFSMPATYDEPKGLSILEAMATGVPVVLPRRGAFPEIVDRTGGGVLVPADDPEALADGLHSVLADRSRAAALGAAGAAGVRREYSVDRMAAAAEAVYQDLARC
jgi:glycosyltransferase involved in cell wall biosynthesis